MYRVFRAAVAVALCTSIANAEENASPAKQYAVFKTSEGNFVCELFTAKSPKTVANFIGLAKGTKDWTSPVDRTEKKDTPLYNGTVFHRTIPGFMIQGGDPTGTGIGNPGYRFADEFSDLKFTKKGLLAMANSGPNSNGCQFFVTVAPTEHLTNKHTIFGEVVQGYDVVEKIANKPSGANGKVMNPVKLETVTIIDKLPTKSDDSKTTASK